MQGYVKADHGLHGPEGKDLYLHAAADQHRSSVATRDGAAAGLSIADRRATNGLAPSARMQQGAASRQGHAKQEPADTWVHSGAYYDDDRGRGEPYPQDPRGQPYPPHASPSFAPVAGPSRPPSGVVPPRQLDFAQQPDSRSRSRAVEYDQYNGRSPMMSIADAHAYHAAEPVSAGPPPPQRLAAAGYRQPHEPPRRDPPYPNDAANGPRPAQPTVEGLLGHIARTEELRLVRARCKHINEARARGVYPPDDSRAGQPYPVEEQIHLDRQALQCSNREIVIIEACEAFFRAHGGQAHVVRCAEHYQAQQQKLRYQARMQEAARWQGHAESARASQQRPVERPSPQRLLRIDTHAADKVGAGPATSLPASNGRQTHLARPAPGFPHEQPEAQPRSAPPTQQSFPQSATGPRTSPANDRPAFRSANSFHQIQRAPAAPHPALAPVQQHAQQQAFSFHQHQPRAVAVPPSPSRLPNGKMPVGTRTASNRHASNGYFDEPDMSAFGITHSPHHNGGRAQPQQMSPGAVPRVPPVARSASQNVSQTFEFVQDDRSQPTAPGPSRRSPRHPTLILAEAGNLAELQAQISPQHFFGMLSHSLSRRGEGPPPERCFIGPHQVDLFQFSQLVIGRCAGYVQVDHDNAWARIASILLPTSGGDDDQSHLVAQLRDLYLHYISPYEDDWSSEMLRRQNSRPPAESSPSMAHLTPPSESLPQPPPASSSQKPRSRPASRLGGPVQFAPISTPATHASASTERVPGLPSLQGAAPASTPSDHASQRGSGSAAPSPTSPRSRASTLSSGSSMFASAFGAFGLGPNTAITTDTTSSATKSSPEVAITPAADEPSLEEILAQVDAHQRHWSMQGASTTTTPLEPPAVLPALVPSPQAAASTAPSPALAAVTAAGQIAPFSQLSALDSIADTPPLHRAASDSAISPHSDDSAVRSKRSREDASSRDRNGDEARRRKRDGAETLSPRKALIPVTSATGRRRSAESTPDLVPSGSLRPSTTSSNGSALSPLFMGNLPLPGSSPNDSASTQQRKNPAGLTATSAPHDHGSSTPSTLGATSDFDLLSLTTPITTEFPSDQLLPPPVEGANPWPGFDLFVAENGGDTSGDLQVDVDAQQFDPAAFADLDVASFDTFKPMLSPQLGDSSSNGGTFAPPPGSKDRAASAAALAASYPNAADFWHPSSLLDFEFAADSFQSSSS